MKKKSVKSIQVQVECVIPTAGYVHDLTMWLGRRSIINGKMVWRPWIKSSDEFIPVIKKLQAEKDIQLTWRILK